VRNAKGVEIPRSSLRRPECVFLRRRVRERESDYMDILWGHASNIWKPDTARFISGVCTRDMFAAVES